MAAVSVSTSWLFTARWNRSIADWVSFVDVIDPPSIDPDSQSNCRTRRPVRRPFQSELSGAARRRRIRRTRPLGGRGGSSLCTLTVAHGVPQVRNLTRGLHHRALKGDRNQVRRVDEPHTVAQQNRHQMDDDLVQQIGT
jgi:hypothetical protein